MANPSILLVAPPAGTEPALRERLKNLGFNCLTPDEIGNEWDKPEMILLVAGEGKSLVDSTALSKANGPLDTGLPLVLVGSFTDQIPEELDLDEALAADVSDEQLASRLHIWCRWGRMARRLKAVEANPDAEAYMDPLTGLPGNRALMTKLAAEVLRHDRYEVPVGLVLGDVADLRSIINQYGHATGDMVLKELGVALRRAIRLLDSLMRYSGDTFAIILPQAGADATAKAAIRIRNMVSNLIFRGVAPENSSPPLLKITLEVGYASLPAGESKGRGGLLAAAEASLAAERTKRQSPTISA